MAREHGAGLMVGMLGRAQLDIVAEELAVFRTYLIGMTGDCCLPFLTSA